MEQLNMLWAYQLEDMKADRLAMAIRRSPNRQKLEKNRAFIMEQQKIYNELGEKMAQMADRIDVIREALPRCEEQLAALQQKVEQNPPADLESVRALMSELSRCQDTIIHYETEMRRMAKDSATYANRQQACRKEAARVKIEFDALKVSYEAELKEQKAALDAQRAVADEKAKGIDPALLEEYAVIKKHITPPMAKLIGDQCGGCNTSLPSAVLRKIKAGTKIECETCGRMIIP